MREITAGIYQIDHVMGANCYLMISGSKMLLIDTGISGNQNKIINFVKRLGKNPSDIQYVILTHADIDHIGSAAAIKKMTGARVAIHARDSPILAGRQGFKIIKGFPGALLKMMTPLMRYTPVEADILLENGLEIGDCKIIHTPGHSPGSICLYRRPDVIFVGDALRSNSKGYLKLPSGQFSADISQANASLITLSELEFDILLTGHGAPVIGKASEKVKALIR